MVANFHAMQSSAGGGVNLDFDASLFVQVGFILLLWVVLKPVLFDPMLKLFAERERRTDGAKAKARKIDEESADAKAKYDDAMAKARAEGASEREKLRNEGLRKESELLAGVRGETQKRMDQVRADTAKQADGVRTELGTHANSLAKDLAGRVLGREVSG